MEKGQADELKEPSKEIAKTKEKQSEMVMASQHMVDLREASGRNRGVEKE